MTEPEPITLTPAQALDVATALSAGYHHLEAYEAHLRRVATATDSPGLSKGVLAVRRAQEDVRDALWVVRDSLAGYVRSQPVLGRAGEHAPLPE